MRHASTYNGVDRDGRLLRSELLSSLPTRICSDTHIPYILSIALSAQRIPIDDNDSKSPAELITMAQEYIDMQNQKTEEEQ